MPNPYLPGVITIPSSLLITAITRSNPMQVTVEVSNTSTESNTYIVGMAVRLNVPYVYGMFQANGLVGVIEAINGSTWDLNINSTQFDAFVVPPSSPYGPATIAPAGSRNLTLNNDTNTVPFQSLTNKGN